LLGVATLDQSLLSLAVIFVVAAVTGYACIHFLLQWLRQRSLLPFAVYCATFGILYLLASFVL
jgi:undecaprenyl pyrophosphate phosphatase UppP